MNKLRQKIETRKIINLILPLTRKSNCLKFYSNETYNHKRKKFELFVRLQKEGYNPIFSECIFFNGKRADLLAIKEGRGKGFEILESETDKQLAKKLLGYPKLVEWYRVKTLVDVQKIEL